MQQTPERQLNQAAFRSLEETIRRNYPAGRFVALSDGQIVADAPDFASLRAALVSLRKDPSGVLIVQAGAEYPETAVILCTSVVA